MRSLVFLLLFCSFSGFGQTYFKDHFGGTVGLSMTIGSHNTSVGINLNGYYSDYFYQVNLGTRFLFFEHGLGNRRHSWESRSVAGLVLVAGKESRSVDFELDGLNHQTAKNLGIGLNYIFYHDRTGTSQAAGGFAVHVHEFALYHENDIFAGTGRDRFRTGQFHFSYQYERFKFTTGIQLWTGESNTAPLHTEGCDDCPAGYRDLSNSKYGRTSHGILYLGWRMQHAYDQNAAVRIGIDAEHVRHIFQNKLIHDIGYLFNRPTPHYPMLDKYGNPTFDASQVRTPKTYLFLGANHGWAY